jgi:hypothetical protein
MIKASFWVLLAVVSGDTVQAQSRARDLAPILKQELLPPAVAQYQLRQYILQRIAHISPPSSAAEWTAESKRLREKILSEVVFHGWPKEWVNAPAKFEEVAVIPVTDTGCANFAMKSSLGSNPWRFYTSR